MLEKHTQNLTYSENQRYQRCLNLQAQTHLLSNKPFFIDVSLSLHISKEQYLEDYLRCLRVYYKGDNVVVLREGQPVPVDLKNFVVVSLAPIKSAVCFDSRFAFFNSS